MDILLSLMISVESCGYTFFKEKSVTFTTFKHFKAFVEEESGQQTNNSPI